MYNKVAPSFYVYLYHLLETVLEKLVLKYTQYSVFSMMDDIN